MFSCSIRMFDVTMQNHKIYKVEQTNDVYCVVSGIPDRIGTHASEMANFTIELMKNIEKFQMKDFPGVEIKVRAGIHSGKFSERNSNQIRKFRCSQIVKFLLLSKSYYFGQRCHFRSGNNLFTGSCAAGVIGHKSLRFSTFGEAVKMA